MRVAVISDIHGNLHALEAALGEIEAESVDEVWCLGDIVGYGPRPNECCDVVRRTAALSLCGNHDLAVVGTLDIADFSGDAAAAARWTAGVLGEEQRSWLASLAPKGSREGVAMFHASARDPVWEYVLSEQAARLSMDATDATIVLVGHSHAALALGFGDDVTGGLARGGTTVELGGSRWLLNPGSVGQPRDGDRRAAWLLLDTAAGTAAFRRVEYPVERTQEEIRAERLPETLAGRLAHGV